MKATKKMASTAKKSATIIAMAAITGASVESTNAAALAAIADMELEFGKENIASLEYTYDPFDGMFA